MSLTPVERPTAARNLLLVTYSFPPFGGVGVHRALSLARYLPPLGWNVHVLTARNPSAVGTDTDLLQQVPGTVQVHHTMTLDLPFGLKKTIKRFAGGNTQVRPRESHAPASRALAGRIMQAVKDVLSPDPQVLWLPFAIPEAARIVATQKIDAVLITVPPFSTLRMASALKKRFQQLTIVSDLRDEWLTYYFPTLGYNRSPAARAEAERIERDCVVNSTRIVTVTENARTEMMHRYPDEPSDKFQVIGNGYEPDIFRNFSARANQSDTVLLGYTGTVYAPSNPGRLAEALDMLPEALRSKLRIRFIGHVENPEYRALLADRAPTVQLEGFLPQARAMQELEGMDFLLLIWNDAINIPGKLYDYLGTGKPILALAKPGGEVWRLLAKTRSGWCADGDGSIEIAGLLREVCTNKQQFLQQYKPDRAAVQSCERSFKAAEYSTVLDAAIRKTEPRGR